MTKSCVLKLNLK